MFCVVHLPPATFLWAPMMASFILIGCHIEWGQHRGLLDRVVIVIVRKLTVDYPTVMPRPPNDPSLPPAECRQKFILSSERNYETHCLSA